MSSNRNNHTTNTRITSVNRVASDEWHYKEHGQDGIHFLTDTSAAPTNTYFAFIAGASTTISSITYLDSSKISGDITGITLVSGVKYYIPGGFSSITLSAGDMILFKYRAD